MKLLSLALSTSLTIAVTLLALPGAWANLCDDCETKRSELHDQKDKQALFQDYLNKNRAYLAQLKPDDSSKLIKVKSNIVIIQLRLETLQNLINPLNDWLHAHSCSQCITRETR